MDIDTTDLELKENIDEVEGDEVVAIFKRNSSGYKTGKVVFTDAFGDQTNIKGNLVIVFKYDAVK